MTLKLIRLHAGSAAPVDVTIEPPIHWGPNAYINIETKDGLRLQIGGSRQDWAQALARLLGQDAAAP